MKESNDPIEALHRSWGRNVRAARGTYWKQQDLAAICGIASSYLSNIEAGRRCPTDDVKRKLAGALRRPIGELFPWPDDIPPFPSVLLGAGKAA